MPVGRDTEFKSTPSSSSTLTNGIQPPASPAMRKASPLPLPAYPTPSAPWQYSHNPANGSHNNSATDSSPSSNPSAAGKTSQVLAKLTAENDRLRREIKAEKAAREEAIQQFQALKGRVNRLEEQNATLNHQFDTNESALTRKERRLDDLRITLEEEASRRKRAEEREAEMGRNLGETVSQAAKEVAEAHTTQKMAESAYATISKEYTGLQRRVDLLRQELHDAVSRIDQEKEIHRKQLMRLEILLDQQRHQQEKSDKHVEEMGALIRGYQQTEDNVKALEKQMQETVEEMRWAMRLHVSREGMPS
jgi:chromosome segregation ATPase